MNHIKLVVVVRPNTIQVHPNHLQTPIFRLAPWLGIGLNPTKQPGHIVEMSKEESSVGTPDVNQGLWPELGNTLAGPLIASVTTAMPVLRHYLLE